MVIKTTKKAQGERPKIKGKLASVNAELKFYDSNAREVRKGDDVVILSSSGLMRNAIVKNISLIGKEAKVALNVVCDLSGKEFKAKVTQDSVFERPKRIVSKTAENENRPVDHDIFSKIPKAETGKLKGPALKGSV